MSIKNDMPPLDEHWTHWIPLWSSILGIAFVVGMYAVIVTNTNVMAKEALGNIAITDLSSRDRDEKINTRVSSEALKTAKLEECVLGIKTQLEDIKQQNVRILNKIDGITR